MFSTFCTLLASCGQANGFHPVDESLQSSAPAAWHCRQRALGSIPGSGVDISFTSPTWHCRQGALPGCGVTGTYAAMRTFIYQLETAPEFVIIENVQLSEGTTDEGGLIALFSREVFVTSTDSVAVNVRTLPGL